MLDCFEEGNELLGDYNSTVVSVHDPDEYLVASENDDDLATRREDILSAYLALVPSMNPNLHAVY